MLSALNKVIVLVEFDECITWQLLSLTFVND